ncbi:MAG: glycosyltransferase [Ramlibacter sp.]
MHVNIWGHWLLMGCAASFAACILLVATKSHHGHLTLDSTIGVQKFHEVPTPRIGGGAVVVGLLLLLWNAPDDLARILWPVLLAGTPAFAVGLWEDLTKRVPVPVRLACTMASGALACWLTGVSLTRVNVPGVDALLSSFVPLSVLFTCFAVSGASNAFNIIDGFNGLAGGVVLIALAALALIAARVGDQQIVMLCLAVAAVTLGFLLVNFPLGKIFLGDGGAYLLGFLVAWIAVLLPMRNPAVSVWATLLACGYPILETLFSIVRKIRRRGHNPGQPDHVHLHMLLYSRVSRRVYPHASRAMQNALTSPFAWAYALLPAACAVMWFDSTPVLVVSFAAVAFVYRAIYLRLTQFRWCFSPATKRHQLPAVADH